MKQRIILFDMDGTLFAGDSQLRFCRWVLRKHGWRRLYLAAVAPCGILRGLHIFNTERMKRAFLAYAWHMPTEQLMQHCREFVQQEIIPALYPPVLEKLRAHQAAGDTTVLCSASPDWWTQLVGQTLGFTHTIGTPTETFERVPFMPSIPAPGNNKGANKLVRLAEIGITHADIGYTDSAADLPMLSICDRAVLVNPKATFAAQVPGAEILTPPKNLPKAFALSCVLGL
ncbi:MAG: haloacid dehalogenase-like hydrolase [Akkermansia sp.]|nr:haloacid dehalogenase-like hydrolase [Akkermansia sp.]